MLFTVGAVVVGESVILSLAATAFPPVPLHRNHSGLHPAALQDDLPGGQVLLLPWRAPDEDAADAGAPLTGF